MIKFLIALFFLLLATEGGAAIICESPNGGIPYSPGSLSIAATSNSCKNTNVVVTSALSAVQSNISSATVHSWPIDRSLEVRKGGSVSNTTKFNVNGPVKAGLYKIFNGPGTVSGLNEARVEWFGADNTGNIDSTTAWNNAVSASKIIKATGNYLIIGTVTISGISTKIIGVDGCNIVHSPILANTDCIYFSPPAASYNSFNGISGITLISTSSNTRYLVSINNQSRFRMDDVYCNGGNAATAGIYITGGMFIEITKSYFYNFAGAGFIMRKGTISTTTTSFYNCVFEASGWGMDVDGGSVNFYDCTSESSVTGGLLAGLTDTTSVGIFSCHFESNPIDIRAGQAGTTLYSNLDIRDTKFLYNGVTRSYSLDLYHVSVLLSNPIFSKTTYIFKHHTSEAAPLKSGIIIQSLYKNINIGICIDADSTLEVPNTVNVIDNVGGDKFLSLTNVSFAANADTLLYSNAYASATGTKRLILTKAIVIAGSDAGTTSVSIGQQDTPTDFIPTTSLANLDAQYDAVILMPIPSLTPPKIKSYPNATNIKIRVSGAVGGTSNTVLLFGALY